MKYVYILEHVCYLENDEEVVICIGIYSNKRKGKIALNRVSKLSEFANYIEGFHLERCKLNRSGWTEGFVTYFPGDDCWS